MHQLWVFHHAFYIFLRGSTSFMIWGSIVTGMRRDVLGPQFWSSCRQANYIDLYFFQNM